MCAEDHPRKRPKVENEEGIPHSEEENEHIDLPAELWGQVLDHLPFSDVITCAAVSRHFLRDALPHVSKLSIYKKEELRTDVARRFRKGNVSDIAVYCLITCLDPDEDEEKFSLCQETASRIIPFLCEFNHKLQSVGLDVDASGIPLGTYFRDTFIQQDAVEVVRSLVRAICGAYTSGAISQKCQIYGPAFQAGTFICYMDRACNLCKLYCQSFPLDMAVNARATCISMQERLDTIASRSGGPECLASSTLVLELLRSNYEVPFEMERAPGDIIEGSAKVFSKAVMEELEILCKNYFNSKSLTPEEVLEALTGEDEDEEVWLVQKYYEKLRGLGIPLSDTDVFVIDESQLLSDVHIHM
jgi:hypothetical protein